MNFPSIKWTCLDGTAAHIHTATTNFYYGCKVPTIKGVGCRSLVVESSHRNSESCKGDHLAAFGGFLPILRIVVPRSHSAGYSMANEMGCSQHRAVSRLPHVPGAWVRCSGPPQNLPQGIDEDYLDWLFPATRDGEYTFYNHLCSKNSELPTRSSSVTSAGCRSPSTLGLRRRNGSRRKM